MTKEAYQTGRKEIEAMVASGEISESEASKSHAILAAERNATIRKTANARAIRQVYADCGLKRVKGALGGIYYE